MHWESKLFLLLFPQLLYIEAKCDVEAILDQKLLFGSIEVYFLSDCTANIHLEYKKKKLKSKKVTSINVFVIFGVG